MNSMVVLWPLVQQPQVLLSKVAHFTLEKKNVCDSIQLRNGKSVCSREVWACALSFSLSYNLVTLLCIMNCENKFVSRRCVQHYLDN